MTKKGDFMLAFIYIFGTVFCVCGAISVMYGVVRLLYKYSKGFRRAIDSLPQEWESDD